VTKVVQVYSYYDGNSYWVYFETVGWIIFQRVLKNDCQIPNVTREVIRYENFVVIIPV
jgi:hypothetical protein